MTGTVIATLALALTVLVPAPALSRLTTGVPRRQQVSPARATAFIAGCVAPAAALVMPLTTVVAAAVLAATAAIRYRRRHSISRGVDESRALENALDVLVGELRVGAHPVRAFSVAATEADAAGGRAVAIRADLLNRDDVSRLVSQAREALGPITILVNNAAFTAPGRPPKPGAEARKPADAGAAKADWPAAFGTPLSAYRRHFEIAVFAAYELMQLVLPDMTAAGSGSIINITSGASRLPGDGPYPDRSGGPLAGYGGSKAALEHLTRCAAYDLQGRHIAVNALSPSKPILTPGLSYYAREFDEVAGAEEFAAAAVKLAQVESDVVTGRVIGHREVLDGSFRPYEYGDAAV